MSADLILAKGPMRRPPVIYKRVSHGNLAIHHCVGGVAAEDRRPGEWCQL